MNSIYLISTHPELIGDSRAWGFYFRLKDAREAVTQNIGGMDDCMYKWLVIERIEQGVFCPSQVVEWYLFNSEKECWELSPAPEWAKGLCNFGIG